MTPAGGHGSGSARAGVLDAGVVLTRLDRHRRSHREVVALFDRSARGAVALSISIVNLAEVLEHARLYADATGIDPVAVLTAFKIGIDSSDLDVARRVALLSSLADASLADRFAIATAQAQGAKLHTTDLTLARAAVRLRLSVTTY